MQLLRTQPLHQHRCLRGIGVQWGGDTAALHPPDAALPRSVGSSVLSWISQGLEKVVPQPAPALGSLQALGKSFETSVDIPDQVGRGHVPTSCLLGSSGRSTNQGEPPLQHVAFCLHPTPGKGQVSPLGPPGDTFCLSRQRCRSSRMRMRMLWVRGAVSLWFEVPSWLSAAARLILLSLQR